MWYIGVDLHRKSLTVAAVDDAGQVRPPVRFDCQNTEAIVALFTALTPFRAVIEATSTYRWLADLLCPLGTVVLAHPQRLRAMTLRRSKTDRLDSQLLAQLLRLNQIPLAYIPEPRYQRLRELTRYRGRLTQALTQVKISLRLVLARHNRIAPYKSPFGPRGRYWFSRQDFGPVDNLIRDELLQRFAHFEKQIDGLNAQFENLRQEYPEVEALLVLPGIGLYSALMIVGEFGDVLRFRKAKQAAAYTGLTTRVFQSGDHCRHGHISRQGSAWLRWIMLEAAMKFVRKDVPLANFYERIRKRSSAKIARVAAARKLAEICWKRLVRWQRALDRQRTEEGTLVNV
jgi:transposase